MRRERGVTTPMRRRLSVLVAAALLLGAWSGQAAPVRFVVEPEKSQVAYVSGTQLGEFRGDTTAVGGEILMDPQDPSRLRLAVSADHRRLKSDNARRDQHMYEQVFEVARFPKATFTAGEFRPSGAGDGQGVLVGTFTLHGVERVVSVPIRTPRRGPIHFTPLSKVIIGLPHRAPTTSSSTTTSKPSLVSGSGVIAAVMIIGSARCRVSQAADAPSSGRPKSVISPRDFGQSCARNEMVRSAVILRCVDHATPH